MTMRALHHFVSAPRRWASTAALLLTATLVGCASLPPPEAREFSPAHVATDHTNLADVVAASTPEVARLAGHSGFVLLPDGDHAWDARLALIERAERAIDAQYYSIAGDASGQTFLRALQQAAQRGLRVRLLVDDLFSGDAAPWLTELARHAEVRVFNPLPARHGPLLLRLALSAHEFSRINRRMHNKLLVADERVAISGGRNIGDEYFLGRADAHFVDLDVLSAGPVVHDMSRHFERFWTSPLSRSWAELNPALAAPRAEGDTAEAPAAPTRIAAPLVLGADSLQQTPLRQALAEGRLALHWGPAQLLADAPEPSAASSAGASSLVSPPNADSSAMLQAVAWMTQAQHDVLIVSPYFIPGAAGLQHIEQGRQRGIQVRLLTNSASATDEPLAHWRWARYRQRVAELGVQVHELSPRAHQAGRGGSGASMSAAARLHSKWAVVDGRSALVGSMNMDNRSARLNTEMGLIIHSRALAQELLHGPPGAMLADAWRVQHTAQGLRWLSPNAHIAPAAEAEPGLARRLFLMLMSALVPEDLL